MTGVNNVFKLERCVQSFASWSKEMNTITSPDYAAKSAFALTLEVQIHFLKVYDPPKRVSVPVEQCCCEKLPHEGHFSYYLRELILCL